MHIVSYVVTLSNIWEEIKTKVVNKMQSVYSEKQDVNDVQETATRYVISVFLMTSVFERACP